MIVDSGNRREFSSGAVRDIQEGKGRCDLMPLEMVSILLVNNRIIGLINSFVESGDTKYLYHALTEFANRYYQTETETLESAVANMLLEVSKHFEEGAKKYGPNNWQKGILTHSYIDSAIRHYLKLLRGDKDENHDRAFVWNILACLYTIKNKPEFIDIGVKEDG